MAWFLADPRGPQWKRGWRGQTLSSLSFPPPRLLAVLAIVILFLSLSSYTEYRATVHRTELGFRWLLFLLPVAILVVALRCTTGNGGRIALRLPWPQRQEAIHRAGGSPWGVAVLVVVLLLMVSYQSSFHSHWFRPLWSRTY